MKKASSGTGKGSSTRKKERETDRLSSQHSCTLIHTSIYMSDIVFISTPKSRLVAMNILI